MDSKWLFWYGVVDKVLTTTSRDAILRVHQTYCCIHEREISNGRTIRKISLETIVKIYIFAERL